MGRILLQDISESELKILLQQIIRETIVAELKNILPQLIRPPINESNSYLTRQEVCKLLKISLPTLNTYTKDGLIKAKRLGQTIRYLEKEVHAAFEEVRNQKYKKQY